MHVLTVRQPYASALAHGVKTVENREWAPPAEILGRWLLIHAGRSTAYIDDLVQAEYVRRELWPDCPYRKTTVVQGGFTWGSGVPTSDAPPPLPFKPWPLGVVVGVARLVGSQKYHRDGQLSQDPWACGPICWLFEDAQVLEQPFELRGMPGVFLIEPGMVPDESLRQIRSIAKDCHARSDSPRRTGGRDR